MKCKILIYTGFIVFSCFSCTEGYNSFPEINSTTLVVNGCVTNEKGPYRIRLLESVAKGYKVETAPVLDARLTITDHLGNVDELKPLWKEQIVTVYKDENDKYGRDYLLMPNYDGGHDTLAPTSYSGFDDYLGAYYSTNIVGTPGGTYTLDITQNGKTYTAKDRMPFVTELDSIVVRNDGKYVEGKEQGVIISLPYLYFKKPEQGENHFLFTYKPYSMYHGSLVPKTEKFEEILFRSSQMFATWNYVAVSDRFMPSYVSGFKITGASSDPINSGKDLDWLWNRWDIADCYIVSVSREACLFFQALTEQFYQDGGAFSPAPASPPTNLSNGAQGFFMAAAVDQKRALSLAYQEWLKYQESL